MSRVPREPFPFMHHRTMAQIARFAAFALGVVLIASSDWALVAPTQPELPPICAPSAATCAAAARAIRNGILGWEALYTDCQPSPNCRERTMGREDCIVGFDCREDRPR
jgi:hypothetical protein